MKRVSSELIQKTQRKSKENQCKNMKRRLSEGRKRKWTPEEDEQLNKLIKKYGTKNWRIIASQLKQRLPKQCRERWINHLDSNIKKGKLTEEEWTVVVTAQEELGNKSYNFSRWSEIAKLLPGRTPNQIKNVWHTMARRETKQKLPDNRKFSLLNEEFSENSDSEETESNQWESEKRIGILKNTFDFVPKICESQSDSDSDQSENRKRELQNIQKFNSNQKIKKESEKPMTRLEALVEIALNMYKIDVQHSKEEAFCEEFSAFKNEKLREETYCKEFSPFKKEELRCQRNSKFICDLHCTEEGLPQSPNQTLEFN